MRRNGQPKAKCNGQAVQERIEARLEQGTKICIHNDLPTRARYFNDVIQKKITKGTRDANAFDGMGCALMVAYASEANLNVMGKAAPEPLLPGACYR